MGIGAFIGLGAAALLSFEYHRYTGWTDERVDPYTIRAVCKTTTYVGMFGKIVLDEGPQLPAAECKEAINIFLTTTPSEGCSVDKTALTARCEEPYKYPFY